VRIGTSNQDIREPRAFVEALQEFASGFHWDIEKHGIFVVEEGNFEGEVHSFHARVNWCGYEGCKNVEFGTIEECMSHIGALREKYRNAGFQEDATTVNDPFEVLLWKY
jgi:hypothetical protein